MRRADGANTLSPFRTIHLHVTLLRRDETDRTRRDHTRRAGTRPDIIPSDTLREETQMKRDKTKHNAMRYTVSQRRLYVKHQRPYVHTVPKFSSVNIMCIWLRMFAIITTTTITNINIHGHIRHQAQCRHAMMTTCAVGSTDYVDVTMTMAMQCIVSSSSRLVPCGVR